MKQDFDIDFVIPWVDGSDSKWIFEFNKYAPKEKQIDIDVSKERYRDYGLLKYWFRGVEKFAPWVHKVHFVTCGQKPDWLNLNATKLHWVKHEDYIPKEFLPVFSANPIELYMHKIPSLAEHFVYFNDDFYLTAPVQQEEFFKNGLPCDSAILTPFNPNHAAHLLLNDIEIINRHFSKSEVVKENFYKWWSLKYGSALIRNLCLSPWPYFMGILITHMPQPFLKSEILEVWSKEKDILSETMNQKFRSTSDVNQWLFKIWTLCKGKFYPVNPFKSKKYFSFDNDYKEICSAICTQKYHEIVINDCGKNSKNFDLYVKEISNAFESILPEKSSFEL